jgi:DNA-binding MarR family transcriptional regulator
MVAVYTYRTDGARTTDPQGTTLHLTRETAEQLTAGVAHLVRTAKHLGHRVASDLYGDLPSFGWALLVPLEQGGEQRCSALATHVGVDVSVASRQVSALERSGYVQRRPDPIDGRASLISLSPAGAEALAHTRDVRSQWAAEALADWSEDDARQLTVLLEKLADGLDSAGRRRLRRPVIAAG